VDTKVNVLSDIEHELEVTLNYDEITEEINAAYKKEGKSISVPGFRKGKVPMHMLQKLYGEAIEYKAAEDIANKKYWDIVKDKKLEPISAPSMTDLDFKRGEKLFFKVKYEVKPTLEVKDYTGQEIDKPVFNFKEEDVDKEIEILRKSHATFEDAEKITDENYKITVDLQALDENGTIIVGQKNENFQVDLSDEKVNPVIAQNANGKKLGDSFKFSFMDEHNHGEETHSKEHFFNAEVKKIEKIVLAEETEDFYKKASKDKATNRDEMKELIRGDYNKYFTEQSEKMYQNNLFTKIVANNEFKVPQGYVATILERLIKLEKENAKKYGMAEVDDAKLRTEMHPRAEWNAKWQIVLESIADKENIKVEDSDLEKLAKEESEKTNIPVDKLVNFYKSSGRDIQLIEDKVVEFLKENNKVKEIDAADFNKNTQQ